MASHLSPRDRSLRRSAFLFPVLFWLAVAALLTACGGGGEQGLDEPIELPICQTVKQAGLQNPPCRVRQPGDL